MLSEVTTIMGKTVRIVYDTKGEDFWHDSGAVLEFKQNEIAVYKIDWDGYSEFVILVKDADDVSALIKASWQCFFKILDVTEDNSEDYAHLSKNIYSQAFLDVFDDISEVLTSLQDRYAAVEESECAQYCPSACCSREYVGMDIDDFMPHEKTDDIEEIL